MRGRLITIGKRMVGEGRPTFIIAEAGVNHNGKLSLARKLIDAAARAGADAIKFQTFSPDELVTRTAEKAVYQKANKKDSKNPSPSQTRVLPLRNEESQHAMLKKLVLKREDHSALKSYAEKKGLIFLSTPFSLSNALFLKKLGVPAIKVSSGDANNIPFLARIAKWKLPILFSTGMSDMREIKESVTVLREAGNKKIIALQCTTNYPTPFEEANLRVIETLRTKLGLLVGFSDHTLGDEAALASVALGAVLIEKHLTLDKRLSGPDHKTSLEPQEFKAFVERIRNVEKALGTGKKTPFRSETEIAKVARKSVATLLAVRKGEVLTEKNLGVKRPGTGLPPKYYDEIIGKHATRELSADTLLERSDVE